MASYNANDTGIATGIAKVDGKILVILDFEKIVSDINKTAGLDLKGAENIKATAVTAEKHIVIVEDSLFLQRKRGVGLHISVFGLQRRCYKLRSRSDNRY